MGLVFQMKIVILVSETKTNQSFSYNILNLKFYLYDYIETLNHRSHSILDTDKRFDENLDTIISYNSITALFLFLILRIDMLFHIIN